MAPHRQIVVSACVLLMILMACGADQDPRLEPDSDAPATTSDTLGRCPAGGPDSTTPPAGCLDADGRVVRG